MAYRPYKEVRVMSLKEKILRKFLLVGLITLLIILSIQAMNASLGIS